MIANPTEFCRDSFFLFWKNGGKLTTRKFEPVYLRLFNHSNRETKCRETAEGLR